MPGSGRTAVAAGVRNGTDAPAPLLPVAKRNEALFIPTSEKVPGKRFIPAR